MIKTKRTIIYGAALAAILAANVGQVFLKMQFMMDNSAIDTKEQEVARIKNEIQALRAKRDKIERENSYIRSHLVDKKLIREALADVSKVLTKNRLATLTEFKINDDQVYVNMAEVELSFNNISEYPDQAAVVFLKTAFKAVFGNQLINVANREPGKMSLKIAQI